MKTIKQLIIALIISSLIFACFLPIYNKKVEDGFDVSSVKNNSIRYGIEFKKYMSYDAIAKSLTKDTILLMGSSELIVNNDFEEHPKQLLDYKDKNIMQVGEGYFQSLFHAIALGSVGNDIKNKTVNLIVSMQWFEDGGIKPEAFLYRFSMDHINHFYKNDRISKQLKDKVYNRILELSKGNEVITNHIERLKRNNTFDKVINEFYLKKYRNISMNFLKNTYTDKSVNEKTFKGISNWDELEKKAIERSKEESTSNSFYLNNQWYTRVVGDDLKKFKNSATKKTYKNSTEYGDLQLFLDVAKELGIKVNLILQPLQGYWADYIGVSHDEINDYYKRIKKIAKENGANLIDYSKNSYEKYFFKDATHLGRLGLLRMQEDLLKYND